MRLLAVDNVMPEFGLYADSDNQAVYAIWLDRNGKSVTEVVGRVSDISFEEARKAASELKTKLQSAKPRPHTPRNPTKSRRRPRIHRQRSTVEPLEQAVPSDPSSRPAPITPPAGSHRKLVSFAELKRNYNIPLSRRQIDRLEAGNAFPKRVPLTAWRVAWVTVEIENWIDARIAARRMDPGMLGTGAEKRPGKGHGAKFDSLLPKRYPRAKNG